MKINCIRFTLTEIASIFESLVVNKAKFFYFFRENQIIFRTVAKFQKFRQLYHFGHPSAVCPRSWLFSSSPFQSPIVINSNFFINVMIQDVKNIFKEGKTTFFESS